MKNKKTIKEVNKRTSGRTTVISKSMRIVDDETRREETNRRIKQLEADAYMEELMSFNFEKDDEYDENDEDMSSADKIALKRERNRHMSNMKNKQKAAQKGMKQKLSKWMTRKFKPLERIIEEQGYQYATLNQNKNEDASVVVKIEHQIENNDSVDENVTPSTVAEGPVGKKRKLTQTKSRKQEQQLGGKLSKTQMVQSYESLDPYQHINYLTIATPPSMYPRRYFCSICGAIGTYSCLRCGTRVCSSHCSESHKETACLKFGYQ